MQREVDADFAGYVRARQHRLLRAAYLVCGDTRQAVEVLEEGLADVAARWGAVREYPDTVVRQHVYRRAVAALKRARRDPQTRSLADEVGCAFEGDGTRTPDVRSALDALSPRQRALLVLRYFDERSDQDVAEVMGESRARVVADTQAAAERVAQQVVGGGDLVDLFDVAAQQVVEVDVADRAWALALTRRRTRRRRVLGAVGSIAAVGVVVAVAQGAERGGGTPSPAPSTTVTAPVKRLSDGTLYASMPLEGDEDQLPDYDAGLPSQIDPTGPTVKLSSSKVPPTDVVAVYLRRAGAHYRAVLVPKGRTQVVVDSLDLLPTRDADGNEGVPLGPKAVSADGRWVVFAQPGAVVRLDLRTGRTQRYAVPASDLEVAGWGDGLEVVARSAGRAWTLDLGQQGAASGGGAPPAVAADVPVPINSGLGVPVTDLAGETVSAGQWSASGAYFDQDVTSPVIVRGNGPIYQGLLAVDFEAHSGRVLLAPESPDGRTGRFKGCCTVLAWADASTVLFRSTGYDGSWVLAWNVQTGRVYDVTRLDEGGGVDYPQALALAVGSRG
ncbi:hypothetical protein ASD62_18205 [Phycicoccus sp. Root563]|uniref:sigma factor-like helix-turn-helix DNA-binding protein n=1 Tax=Phycicoccus sp. Root563 TaxID=1736562 RepID=UPI00070331C0|nr:sigma factor-like helix-turn-helix DNA-binding protein [Phycicoccus sp. Root563]KQZ87506.1 hypothetical protein ASD62_18205 [Phycicoccus sp. Root563]